MARARAPPQQPLGDGSPHPRSRSQASAAACDKGATPSTVGASGTALEGPADAGASHPAGCRGGRSTSQQTCTWGFCWRAIHVRVTGAQEGCCCVPLMQTKMELHALGVCSGQAPQGQPHPRMGSQEHPSLGPGFLNAKLLPLRT